MASSFFCKQHTHGRIDLQDDKCTKEAWRSASCRRVPLVLLWTSTKIQPKKLIFIKSNLCCLNFFARNHGFTDDNTGKTTVKGSFRQLLPYRKYGSGSYRTFRHSTFRRINSFLRVYHVLIITSWCIHFGMEHNPLHFHAKLCVVRMFLSFNLII